MKQTDEYQIGDMIGPWRLEHVLGKGGMGSVWLAERADGAVEMQAAIKLMRPEIKSLILVRRFRRERQILADLRHPNIGALMDVGAAEDDRPYLVMEYIDGDLIDRYCNNYKLSRTERVALFRQACNALAHAHRKGVIHRDIKPANIMVNADGVVKLMDFGIARLTEDGEESFTRPGQIILTPEYASPEQLRWQVAEAASDIYSLGLVLVQLLTNRLPREWGEDPATSVADWLLQNTSEEDAQHTRFLSTIIAKALAQNMVDRYESVEYMIEDLDSWLTQETSSSALYDAVLWHAEADQAAVESLVNHLQHLKLWLPWSDNTEDFESALGSSPCLLVCLGEHAPWTQSTTPDLSPLLRRHRIVPVLLPQAKRPERESALPAFMRRHTWISLTSVSGDEDIKKLTDAIKGQITGPITAEPIKVCPFRGLEVFREEDAPYFFGREALTQRLTNHMRRNRFLALLGPSGSGKSSVAQAGLIPQLRQAGVVPILFTPTASPLAELAFALYQALPEQARFEQPGHIHQRLKTGHEALHFMMPQLLQGLGSAQICLVVDQFEEIYTLADDPQEREGFVANLLYASEQSDGHLAVVITMRSDFIGKAVTMPNLNSFISDHLIQVEPMTDEELKRCITAPTKLAGLSFEQGLERLILKDIAGASGELPLLEHAMLELWERRRGRILTQAAYDQIGGIEGALARRAESEYHRLDSSGQHALRKIFTLCLIQPGEGAQDTRRHATQEELFAIGGDPSLSETIISRWTEARLLTSHTDPIRSVVTVDVAHEALIRKWDRIRIWMTEDRATARLIERLRRGAQAWDESGRHRDHLLQGAPLLQMNELMEQERSHLGQLERIFIDAGLSQMKRRKQISLVLGSLGFVLAAIAFGLFLRANQAEKTARISEKLANQEKARAEQQTKEANYNLALAFDMKAGLALDEGNAQEAWLLSLAALSQDIPADKSLPEAQGRFIDPRMRDVDKMLWTSPAASFIKMTATSADGSLLALAEEGGVIRLVNTLTGSQLATLGGDHQIHDLAISSDGQWLAAALGNRGVQLRRLPLLQLAPFEQIDRHHAATLAFSGDGQRLAAGGDDGHILILDLQQESNIQTIQLKTPVRDLVFDAATSLYAAGQDGLFRIDSRERVTKILDQSSGLARYGKLVASAHHHTLSVISQEEVTRVQQHEAPITSLASDPNGAYLVLGSELGLHSLSGESIERVTASVPTHMSMDANGFINISDQKEMFQRHKIDRDSEPPAKLAGHYMGLTTIAQSPDQSTIASGSRDGSIFLWNHDHHNASRSFRYHDAMIFGIDFSPDGSRLASASGDQTVKILDLQSDAPVTVLSEKGGQITDVKFSPDGTFIATTPADRSIHLWDAQTGEFLRALQGHEHPVTAIAFSPDGAQIASASFDRSIMIWDVRSGQSLRTLKGHKAMVRDIAYAPNGDLASASFDQSIKVWGSSDQPIHQFKGHKGRIYCLSYSHDGAHLASASIDKTVKLWSLTNKTPPLTFQGHVARVIDVIFTRDDAILASTSDDKTMRFWNPAPPQSPSLIENFPVAVQHTKFSPDGTILAAVTMDSKLTLWDVEDASLIHTDQGHTNRINDLAFSPDGANVATSSSDGSIRILDVQTANLVDILNPEAPIACFSYSPDGGMIAYSTFTGMIQTWDLQSGKKAQINTGHRGILHDLDFSPQGNQLAFASSDRSINLIDLTTSAHTVLKGHTNNVNGIAFSQDGKLLASASYDKTIRLWDTSGELVDVLQGHTGFVYGVTFSPNGQWLASSSADRTVRIWDPKTGESVAVLAGHQGEVNKTLSFSPNSKILATPSEDKTIRLWSMDRMLHAPAGVNEREWHHELFQRSLYFFGYRLDGFNLVPQPRVQLLGDIQAHPYQHIAKPRPAHSDLAQWLMQSDQ